MELGRVGFGGQCSWGNPENKAGEASKILGRNYVELGHLGVSRN